MSRSNQFALLKDRRFLPLFVAQFLGALNDNLFKTLLAVMIAYGILSYEGVSPEVLVAVSAGVFILPFVLLAPIGGVLADRHDKAQIIRLMKAAEVFIVGLAGLGLWLGGVPFLFVVLFGFGVQSALFSPAKFSILPQHLLPHELLGGNALLNTGGFIAILIGTILGGLWGGQAGDISYGVYALFFLAIIGYIFSKYIPKSLPEKGYKSFRESIFSMFSLTFSQGKVVFFCVFGIAWFYLMGGTFLVQFPNFVRESLGADHIVLTLFMALFTAGISLGGLLNNLILKSQVCMRYVPMACLGIAIYTVDLYFAARGFNAQRSALIDFSTFYSAPGAWRVMIDVLMIAVCGGLYVVPLHTVLQQRLPPQFRARVLSVSTVMNALFVLLSSALAIGVFSLGYVAVHLFLLVGILSLIPAVLFSLNKKAF